MLEELEPLVLIVAPLLFWVLLFSARLYWHGRSVTRVQFLEDEARLAEQAWQRWAQRFMTVSTSCVLLPDGVCANGLHGATPTSPPRAGSARHVSDLPAGTLTRAEAGLQLLLEALAPALQSLPANMQLQVVIVTDIQPELYAALQEYCLKHLSALSLRVSLGSTATVGELSWRWLDEQLKNASSELHLVIVLQTQGQGSYSDGLGALLLSTDDMARAHQMRTTARVLRPMPLQVDSLAGDWPVFLQTQTCAVRAQTLLADSADWKNSISEILVLGANHGAAPLIDNIWFQEDLCGTPGPFAGWLTLALGVDLARLQGESCLALARVGTQRWVTTVAPEGRA